MKLMTRILSVLAVCSFSALSYAEQDTLTVIDEKGQPVAGATILLGYEVGNPFGGNVLTTTDAGTANVPSDWKAALPVTVQAPGFIAATLPVALPGNHRILLTKQEGAVNYEIKGKTENFGRLTTDGKVDFALVIPSLARSQMLAFDISSVISPENDTISVIGNSVDLPSNITLPPQTENYIFPIDFDKPEYRSYVRAQGQYQLSALHGQFPLKKVVDEIRGGKSIFEVINNFNFSELGQRDVSVKGPTAGANISVNQVPLNTTVSVKAPAYAAAQDMIAMAMVEKNGLLIPTDLKRLTPNQTMTLKSNAALGTPAVVSVLLDKPTKSSVEDSGDQLELIQAIRPFVEASGDEPDLNIEVTEDNKYDLSRLSLTIASGTTSATPQFLPLVAKPQVSNQNIVKLQVPALNAGLIASGTVLVFSEIEKLGNGKVKNERRTRLWEVFSTAWLAQIELPKVAFKRRSDRTYRWEVLFLARPVNSVPVSGPANSVDLNSVTHVTRNAIDL